jgi:hypothetical protein
MEINCAGFAYYMSTDACYAHVRRLIQKAERTRDGRSA